MAGLVGIHQQLRSIAITYAHYWRHPGDITEAAWAVLVEQVAQLFEYNVTAEDEVRLAGWDGSGMPEITDEEIRFNGLAPDDYETFAITRQGDIGAFGSCKTAHRPYDNVVVAVLLIAHHTTGLNISSDGLRDEWEPGAKLAERATGEPYLRLLHNEGSIHA